MLPMPGKESPSVLHSVADMLSKQVTTDRLLQAMVDRVVEELGRVNAVGFANIVNAYDPELVTIGGSIALNNPELILGPILENIDRHLINRKPRIMITPLGEDVVLYGALSRAISLI